MRFFADPNDEGVQVFQKTSLSTAHVAGGLFHLIDSFLHGKMAGLLKILGAADSDLSAQAG